MQKKCIINCIFETNNTELISHLLSRKDLNLKAILIEDKFNMETLFDESAEKTLFSMAVENDNIEKVKQLLSYSNIDINWKLSIRNKNTQELIKEYTVLQLAVKKGNREIINLLLNNKAINLLV